MIVENELYNRRLNIEGFFGMCVLAQNPSYWMTILCIGEKN